MGGPGSGYHPAKDRRLLTDDCLQLNTSQLDLKKHQGKRWSGEIVWRDRQTGHKMAGTNFLADLREEDRGWFLLSYRVKDVESTVQQIIHLTSIVPHFSGRRYFFRCSLCTAYGRSPARVQKLYLPMDGRKHFGCRACHRLSYWSSASNHRWDKMLSDIALKAYGRNTSEVVRTLRQNLAARLGA